MFLKSALSSLQPRLAGFGGPEAIPPNGQPAHTDFQLLTAFLDQAPVLAWITDRSGRFVYLSPAYFARFGGNALPRTVEPAIDPLWPFAASPDPQGTGGLLQKVETVRGADGETQHILVEYFAISGPDGERYLGAVGVDVTQQQARAVDLTRLAMTDELTGLWNRRGFNLLAAHELKVARRHRLQSAVLYIDVDHLKQANDRYGHDEGDLLLREAAALLRSEFRESDVIGRIGGDEFAVFANDVKDSADVLRDRFWMLFRNFPKARGQQTLLSLSVGAALCTWDQHAELGSMLKQADQSLQESRSLHRHSIDSHQAGVQGM